MSRLAGRVALAWALLFAPSAAKGVAPEDGVPMLVRVTHLEDLRPATGVRVVLKCDDHAAEALTDAKGIAHVVRRCERPHRIDIADDALVVRSGDEVAAHGVGPGGEVEVFVSLAGAIRGRVVGPDGEPRADARIFLVPHDCNEFELRVWRRFMELGWADERLVPVNEDGSFELRGVFPAAARRIEVLAAGHAWRRIDGFDVEALAVTDVGEIALERAPPQEVHAGEGSTQVDAPLRPGHELAPSAGVGGRVVDADGRPVPHCRVVCRVAPDEANALALDHEDVTTTSADGSFRFEGLPEGSCLLQAGPLRGSWTELWLPAVEGAHELALAPPREIRGVVLDPDGAPVHGARVNLEAQRPEFFRRVEDMADVPAPPTDEGGRFTLHVPAHRDLVLRVTHPEWRPRKVRIAGHAEAGRDDLTIGLRRPARVQGVVRLQGALDRHVVTLMPLGEVAGAPFCYARVSIDGSYSLHHAPKGRHSLVVRDGEGRVVAVRAVVVKAGAVTTQDVP